MSLLGKEEAKSAARMMFRGYPLLKVSEETIALYGETFENMTRARAREIIRRIHATYRERPPNLGQVIEACITQDNGHRLSGEEAYVQLTQAVRRWGRSTGPDDPPPKFDPLVQQALGIWGSWNQFCDSDEDDMAGRARFIALYDKLAERERLEKVVPTKPSHQLVSAPERKLPATNKLAVVRAMPEARINSRPTAAQLAEFEEPQKDSET